jgi:RimJ/RimL family protein N-acetyltransferase
MARVYRQCKTHDGRAYVIREAELADAPRLIAHTRAILTEPQWNVTEPREFDPSVDQEESWILSFHEHPHNLLLLADFGAPPASGILARPLIVGMVSFITQARFRVRHRGRLGISVQAPYRRQGVGEALLSTLLDWAKAEPELERVELSVFAHNTRAMNLYRKLGFEEEARLRRSFKLADGTYYDDVMMVRWVK